MSLLRAPWFAMVELFVPVGTGNFINFEQQPQLTTLIDQEIKIMGIEVYTPAVLANAPSGQPNAPVPELQKCLFTAINDDMQRIYQMPLLKLNNMQTLDGAGDLVPHSYDLQLFDRLNKVAWTKSKIEFTTPPANLPWSICLGIYYDKLQGEKTV